MYFSRVGRDGIEIELIADDPSIGPWRGLDVSGNGIASADNPCCAKRGAMIALGLELEIARAPAGVRRISASKAFPCGSCARRSTRSSDRADSNVIELRRADQGRSNNTNKGGRMPSIKSTTATIAMLIAAFGCATAGQYQSSCEKAHTDFAGMAACIKESVASDNRINKEGMKLFAMKAEQLAGRVQSGQMSEIDARVELQQLVVEIDSAERARRQRAIAISNSMNRQSSATCTTIGNQVNCVGR